MTRQRGGATSRRGDQSEQLPSSPTEIGRVLREAREARGLDLVTVHDRLGRPITQLEALEDGALGKLPDQAVALSTLRRYAAFLDLDGDGLALHLMEAWSTEPTTTTIARPRRDPAPVTGVVTAVTPGPDHLRAFTQTGEVPKVGGTSAADGSGGYGYGVTTGPPTGTLSVIPRDEIRETKRVNARARRRRRAPTSLMVITWVVGILAVAAIAGVVIQREHPQWMVQAHLLRITQPDGQPLVAASTTKPVHHVHTVAAPVVPGPTDNSTQATYYVHAKQFTLGIATSGPCWMEITSPASISPLLTGVQPKGTVQAFKANGSITIVVGSSAVVLGITIDGKSVFYTNPKVTPFTYTFTSQS